MDEQQTALLGNYRRRVEDLMKLSADLKDIFGNWEDRGYSASITDEMLTAAGISLTATQLTTGMYSLGQFLGWLDNQAAETGDHRANFNIVRSV